VVKDHSVVPLVLVDNQEVVKKVVSQQPFLLVTLVSEPNKIILKTSSKNVEILRMLEFHLMKKVDPKVLPMLNLIQ
jgi:hypothetical protein